MYVFWNNHADMTHFEVIKKITNKNESYHTHSVFFGNSESEQLTTFFQIIGIYWCVNMCAKKSMNTRFLFD